MTTLTIKIPNNKHKYLGDENEFQAVIFETMADFFEKKEDLETKDLLLNSKSFQDINSKLEKKLWKL